MAYTDPKPMTTTRLWSIIVVIAIHALLLYAMVNGGYQVAKKLAQDLKVIDIKEPPPPPEELPPPPPPDKNLPPPPVVSPPPIVQTQTVQQPQIQSQPTPPVVYTPTPEPPRPAPPPPPPPPAPPAVAVKGAPRGSPQSWVTTDDYPPSAIRDGVEGTTSFTLQVGPDGRVTSCAVTGSSGSSQLDDAACRLLTRRARFSPAKDTSGTPIAFSYSNRTRWQIPKE